MILPKDFDDNDDLSYADNISDLDARIKAVPVLIDGITIHESVPLLYKMLKMGTHNLSDGTIGGLFFGLSDNRLTKGFLKQLAKKKDLIVVRTPMYKPLDKIIHHTRLGVFYDGISYNTAVTKSDLYALLFQKVEKGEFDIKECMDIEKLM